MLLFPRSAAAEAFRALRTNVEFSDVDAGLRSLLVTSPEPGDGKSTVAANLALAFAQAGVAPSWSTPTCVDPPCTRCST